MRNRLWLPALVALFILAQSARAADLQAARQIVESSIIGQNFRMWPRFDRLRYEQCNATGLPTAEKAAIFDYSISGDELITQAMRKPRSAAKERLAEAVLLRNALELLPPYRGVTFRGDSERGRYRIGKTIQFDHFLSTSRKSEIAEEFADAVLFTIHSKSGRDISPCSEQPFEQEVLFPPGARFKVLSTRAASKYLEVELEELEASR